MLDQKYRDWLPTFCTRGLSGWDCMVGISFNALTCHLFTPWVGIGINYQALSFKYHAPAVTTGYVLGWGRKPIKQGGLRYRRFEEWETVRYCEELA